MFIRQVDHIDTALAGYFRRENLGQGEDMYKCEKCHQKVPATKQYKIERPPLVLCVQLKRFNMMGGKNGRPVTLARKLNISSHVRWEINIIFERARSNFTFCVLQMGFCQKYSD